MIKTCLICRRMELDVVTGGGGCDSCGYGGEGKVEFNCKANIWNMDLMEFRDQQSLNQKISMAESCPLFWEADMEDKK